MLVTCEISIGIFYGSGHGGGDIGGYGGEHGLPFFSNNLFFSGHITRFKNGFYVFNIFKAAEIEVEEWPTPKAS